MKFVDHLTSSDYVCPFEQIHDCSRLLTFLMSSVEFVELYTSTLIDVVFLVYMYVVILDEYLSHNYLGHSIRLHLMFTKSILLTARARDLSHGQLKSLL